MDHNRKEIFTEAREVADFWKVTDAAEATEVVAVTRAGVMEVMEAVV